MKATLLHVYILNKSVNPNSCAADVQDAKLNIDHLGRVS